MEDTVATANKIGLFVGIVDWVKANNMKIVIGVVCILVVVYYCTTQSSNQLPKGPQPAALNENVIPIEANTNVNSLAGQATTPPFLGVKKQRHKLRI